MRKRKPSLQHKKSRRRSGHKYEILGVILFLLGIFLCMSLFGRDMGVFGGWLRDTLRFFFGMTAVVPCFFVSLLGGRYIYKGIGFQITKRVVLGGILYVLLACWIHYFLSAAGKELDIQNVLAYGGIIGSVSVWGLHILFGNAGTAIFLFAATVSGVLLLSKWSLTRSVRSIGAKTETGVKQVQSAIREKKSAWDEKKKAGEKQAEEEGVPQGFLFERREVPENERPVQLPSVPEDILEAAASEDRIISEAAEASDGTSGGGEDNLPAAQEEPAQYHIPPLSLLHEGKGTGSSAVTDAKKHMSILEATLKSFGVNVKITDVSVGPTVTRYELEPAPGVKVSRITNLQDDIALQLAATHVRIEAPIPGKSAVGIEVPNAKTAEVALRDVLDSSSFQNARGGVPAALGKDITGKPVITDLTKMPHILIAGSTGSGKSVCINTLIMSVLFHARPEEVKLILIDPKVVELSVYNGIPHLRIPVVTDPKKAAGALQWAVREMESRYQQFSEAHVRDIGGYNKVTQGQPMPYIIIIIDELADLMMVASDSVEGAICRLAQKARAAGIHLVLATQRPSVDVITGVIKANIPSRISFAVSSQVDSRTILDMAGAEKLIGKGDMLFNPIGAPNPIRVQGAFISDEEVESVVSYIKAECEGVPSEYEEINLEIPEAQEKTQSAEQEDELLQEAAEWVLDTKKASVSMLQRRFRIGYTRAGRLMDTLESMGIVGPAEGAKPREVLMSSEEAEGRFFRKEQ